MSGSSEQRVCPVCNNLMDVFFDYKPFDMVDGECLHCGFSTFTIAEQCDIYTLNKRRKEYNEGMGIKKNEDGFLPPMKKKEWEKWGKEIKKII